MLAVKPRSVIILMKAPRSSRDALGLFFCGLTQTRQTNNPHHIFTGLIVLMPDQAGDTVTLT